MRLCLPRNWLPKKEREKTYKKTAKLLIYFVVLMLIFTFIALVPKGITALTESQSALLNTDENDSFTPTILKPSWVDKNNNGIADSLEQEIPERIANGTAQEYTNVIVTLKTPPTITDANNFASSGGYLTTSAWTEATYGFGGTIEYVGILNYTEQNSNVLLVEKEAVGKASIAYAAQQVGARTYVWNTLGFQGDPATSIAILDTGIDASHVDFAPGYGSQDFSKKIVGWRDFIGSTTTPTDNNGHGSHVSGLAAGDGFFSVDASGNAIDTSGASLDIANGGTYIIAGMIVNKTGPIALTVKWTRTGTASLSSMALYYNGKALNALSGSQVASVGTPGQNIVYSTTYNVSSTPTDGYDLYHVALVTTGTGNLKVAVTVSWPYMPPSDSFTAWTGIAPQSKLVGVKIMNSMGEGSSTQLINGINWIISNKQTYHITVASMSLGFDAELSQLDSAVVNLVNSGVTTIVAAGNDGSGANRIYTPASVNEVVTVGAMDQFDKVASYSSQGGPSRQTGATTKPDIIAPGGSAYAAQLFSADTNYNDAEGGFPEIQPNDAASAQGTSMSAPVIAGCAQVVVQAMGGYAQWNWTRAQALQPKMILLMTASETYPNLREVGSAASSPTLERGGKDVHEGYGRVNLDAAVDALQKTYSVGSVVTDTLGRPPTTADISVVGQRLVFARNVQLNAGGQYSFSLSVPAGADYDLYLYNNVGTTYGEPSLIDKSINATNGGTEQFWVTAPYSGTYYVVVKRATETTGSGTFVLSSSTASSTVTTTLNTPGLPNALNVVHYIQNGVSRTGSIVANTFTDLVDASTTLTIDNPVTVSTSQRYVTSDQTAFNVQSNADFTINYRTQYSVTVTSNHDTPTASQWIDQGAAFTASVTSPADVIADNSRWVCTGYSLDGGASQLGISSTFTNLQAAHTITFNWKQQFYLTVSSSYGASSGSGWYDSGASASATVTPTTIDGPVGTRYLFAGWGGDASGNSPASNPIIMNGAKTADATWKTQHYLTVTSPYGVAGGSGWYDAGSTAHATLDSGTVSGGTGAQYAFIGWSGDADGTGLSSDSIVMSRAKTANAAWKTQYYLAVSANFGSISVGSGWQDAGSTVTISAAVPSVISGERYVWNGWSGTGAGSYAGDDTTTTVTMNGAVTEAAFWTHQYMLTITTPYGTPTPDIGWYNAGTSISASVTSPVPESFLTQHVCIGWTGTGNAPTAGTSTSVSFMIEQPSTIIWNWESQYILATTALVIAIPIALVAVAIFVLLRRRQTGTRGENALPPPPAYA